MFQTTKEVMTLAYNNPDDSYGQPYLQYNNPYANPYYRNPYQNQYQQPQPQPQQQQPTYAGFQWVRGEAAAKAFRAEPGQTVLLMDSDEPVLYVNSTDVNGKPAPMTVYDLVVRKDGNTKTEPTQDLSDFVKKSEIQNDYIKRSEIEDIIKAYVVKAVNDKMSDIRLTSAAVEL